MKYKHKCTVRPLEIPLPRACVFLTSLGFSPSGGGVGVGAHAEDAGGHQDGPEQPADQNEAPAEAPGV